MSTHTITFESDETKNYVTNARRGSEYSATIQNATDQQITITVTNQNIQSASPTFVTPAAGALVIAAGAVASLKEPYEGWLLTAAAAATGTVDITEAG